MIPHNSSAWVFCSRHSLLVYGPLSLPEHIPATIYTWIKSHLLWAALTDHHMENLLSVQFPEAHIVTNNHQADIKIYLWVLAVSFTSVGKVGVGRLCLAFV